jgi:hypothetical protein
MDLLTGIFDLHKWLGTTSANNYMVYTLLRDDHPVPESHTQIPCPRIRSDHLKLQVPVNSSLTIRNGRY